MSDKILIKVACTESLVDTFCAVMKLRNDAFCLRHPEIKSVDWSEVIAYHPILTEVIDRALLQAIRKMLNHEAVFKQNGAANRYDEIKVLLEKKPDKPTP